MDGRGRLSVPIQSERKKVLAANQWSADADLRFTAPSDWPTKTARLAPNAKRNQHFGENSATRSGSPLQKSAAAFMRGDAERWPSGLRRTLGKRVCGKLYRGFESHSLRHIALVLHNNFSFRDDCPYLYPYSNIAPQRLPKSTALATVGPGSQGNPDVGSGANRHGRLIKRAAQNIKARLLGQKR